MKQYFSNINISKIIKNVSIFQQKYINLQLIDI